MALDSLTADFRRASELGSYGLWKGSMFRFPRQTHPGFVSQRGSFGKLWDTLAGGGGMLLRKPAWGRCLETLYPATTDSRSPTIRGAPRVPERREKMYLFMGDTVRSIRETMGYCGVLWS